MGVRSIQDMEDLGKHGEEEGNFCRKAVSKEQTKTPKIHLLCTRYLQYGMTSIRSQITRPETGPSVMHTHVSSDTCELHVP